jgi:hypothetical protein
MYGLLSSELDIPSESKNRTIILNPSLVRGFLFSGYLLNMKIIITESQLKKLNLEEFAKKRFSGAEKIANTAKEKGGPSILTYQHFVVKLPYYKKAGEGKFDEKKSIEEFKKTLKSISLEMTQKEFQTEVGRLEVLGELIIKNKK